MKDVHGHGTHVAGTAGAFQFGVAEYATLVNVKVLNDTGRGFDDLIAHAINDVVKEHISFRNKGGGVSCCNT